MNQPSRGALREGTWRTISAAPHRLLFLGGTLQILLVMVWWFAELLGRRTGEWTLASGLPSLWAHGFLMVYGTFPFFIFGFLLTVYPRWLGGEPVPRTRYVPIFLLLATGTLLAWSGIVVTPAFLAAGLAVLLCGWGLAWITLFAILRRAPRRGVHETLLTAAVAAGITGLLVFLHAAVTGRPGSFAFARDLGLWLFLLPVVFTVSHRMIPFFSGAVLANYAAVRPAWTLGIFVLGSLGHAALEQANLPEWRFVCDLPMAATALYLSRAWHLRRSFEVRLVAVLHIAFLWFGIAMGLYAVQSLMWLATGSDILGRSALHALGVGFITGMVVAMATRVTLGHSGRPLVADPLTWVAFLTVNASAITRIAGEIWPVASGALNLLSAVLWLVALGPWVARYLPMLLRPRADGKPG